MADKKRPNYNEMVDECTRITLTAFGKGEDLHGAMSLIVNSVSYWAAQNIAEVSKKNG